MQDPNTGTFQTGSASAFIGLQSYTEAQAKSFFGRDNEINNLTKLVESNTLTIVFGKSGTGKTSLLNAGIFPSLRKHYCLPFRIRLEFNKESPDLITQIKNVLKQEIDKYGFKVEAYPSTETLWEYFHKEPLWKTITPILVFDQFEEIFTLAKTNSRFGAKEQALFWEELSDLIENSIPEKLKAQFLNNKEQIGYSYKNQKTKILFSFREEFLPEFETITSKIPSIKYSRFRLMPMNGHQAYDVITKTWKENINPTEARQIVSFFTNDKDVISYDLITVEPSLLSQVCSFIDKERIEEGMNKVSAELLKKYPRETILRTIYNEAVTDANNALPIPSTTKEVDQRNYVKEFLEEKLITTEGYRTKYGLTANDENILPGLAVLKKKYLLREDDNFIELTHDVLTPIIKSDREKRRKEIALAAERKKARKRALLVLVLAVLGAIGLFFWTTREARSENENLKSQIKENKLALAHLIDSIGQITIDPGKGNPSVKTVIERIHDSIINEIKNDSTLSLLKAENDVLERKKKELEKTLLDLDGYIKSLTARQKKSDSTITENKKTIEDLNLKITALNLAYSNLKNAYDKLEREFRDYKLYHPDLPSPNPIPVSPIDTNYNLKLNLYYGSSKNRTKAPGNLTLYLIPYNSNNRKIIADAKLYEIRCDEYNLTKATGYKLARYYKGAYVFSSVAPGKYLVKICTYYGGYYTYTKNSSGTEEFEWDASPPIR
ncbi:MAG: hypothetical protein ACM3H8_03315 [Sphingobacteriales bacterium]